MRVDLSSIIDMPKGFIDIEFDIRPEDFDWHFDYFTIANCVHVKGVITNDMTRIVFLANVNFEIKTQCARCLEDMTKNISFELHEHICSKNDCGNDLAYTYSGKEVDIEPIVYDNVVIQVPNRFLCREDCKGICPKCGALLNNAPCSCETDEVDPRLAVLKDMLEKNEN